MSFITIILLCTFFLLPTVAFTEEMQELWGTWINTDYDEIDNMSSKFVFDSNPHAFLEYDEYEETIKQITGKELDGTYAQYWQTSDTEPWLVAKFSILDEWIDSDVAVIYKMKYFEYTMMGFGWSHFRISPSGEVLERIHSIDWFPEEIDPTAFYYGIYYRQE